MSSAFAEIDTIVTAFTPYASDDDILAWSELSLGATVDALTSQSVSFGGSGQDLFASVDDDGIYYTCYDADADSANYDYVCDYERIGTLYDGWMTGMYMTKLTAAAWFTNADSLSIVD